MPAEIDSMFAVRKRSWHGLENLLLNPPSSIEEARRLAGVEWEPRQVPIYNADGIVIDGFKGIQRDDNNYYLNVARDSYEIILNQETFEIVWSVIGQGAYLDTAGSVREGRQVWALAHLDEPIVIPGDKSLSFPYLVMLTSHDGTAACKVLPTTVRVVCWNTFQMALAEGDRTGYQLSFRHTKRVKDRITQAKLAISTTQNFAEKWKADATALTELKVSSKAMKQFVLEFFPVPHNKGLELSDRQASNVLLNRSTLQHLLENSVTLDGIRDTAYGLVQGAGEWLDHYRNYRGQDAYIGRTLLRPEPEKTRALKLAVKMAKV